VRAAGRACATATVSFRAVGADRVARNRRPLRSVCLNLKEGDSVEELLTAYECAADAVTHELEDHCPDRLKAVARRNIRDVIDARGAEKPTFVRTSTANDPRILADLEAIVCPNLCGVMLPKVESAADVQKVDSLLSLFEARAGVEPGKICILPLPESASGHRNAYDIVKASERVEYMLSATNTNGDPARSIGYHWTRECTETLYIRQKLVLDTRSAGMQWPICSNWNDLSDLEGLRRFLEQNRSFGYFGSLCTPEPKYIALVNEVFTPSQEEVDFWGEIVALQDQYDDDVKIDGRWYVRNKSKWGKLRLELAAYFGVYPNENNRKMKVEQVGGIIKAAEQDRIGDQGRVILAK
jgi:citrate lyase subunit beta/citryl-CoA lyase